jgi:hypothetical protein
MSFRVAILAKPGLLYSSFRIGGRDGAPMYSVLHSHCGPFQSFHLLLPVGKKPYSAGWPEDCEHSALDACHRHWTVHITIPRSKGLVPFGGFVRLIHGVNCCRIHTFNPYSTLRNEDLSLRPCSPGSNLQVYVGTLDILSSIPRTLSPARPITLFTLTCLGSSMDLQPSLVKLIRQK